MATEEKADEIPNVLSDDQVRALIREYEVHRPHHTATHRADILGLLATLERLVAESDRTWEALHDNEGMLIDWLDSVRADVLKLCWEIEKLPASEQQTQITILASGIGSRIQMTADRFREKRRTHPYVKSG